MAMRRSTSHSRRLASPLILLLCLWLAGAEMGAQSSQESAYTFHATSDLVLVDVTVRDRSGILVRDLKASDFTVLEDNKNQHVLSFDIQNTEVALPPGVQQANLLSALKAPANAASQPQAPDAGAFKDRRLMVFFFDLSSMQPEEAERGVAAAENYLNRQMTSADLVAIVSLGNELSVAQDFTSDRALLLKAIQRLNPAAGQGFEEGATGTTEGTPDTGAGFTADDTEYNIFNTDRRLQALRSLMQSLQRIEQKKSLIYFASGMDRTGVENQAELRSAINAAVRANTSVYTLDTRGLQALVAGGEAQQASLRGTSPYSGRAMLNQYNSNFTTQETLVTLAADTGGKAFLDSNDFSQIFNRVQQDTSFYYLLGYRSSNAAQDGQYRHISVRVNRPGVKIEYRRGYYAPADFQHTPRQDREEQLEQELASELPSTDLPIFLSTGYFRIANRKFLAPISIVVPGSEIPFVRSKDRDKASIDVLGVVVDGSKRPVARIRDTIKLALQMSQEVRQKNVQYDTGAVLAPGGFHLKFVVRENQTGRTGSFETDLVIPELKGEQLKMSSVVLASQRQAARKGHANDPMVQDGLALVPSVTHVFSSGQQLYVYYEVYDPAAAAGNAAASASSGPKGAIRVLSSAAFFQGDRKIYETPLVETRRLTAPGRGAAGFLLNLPLAQLMPGLYTCQVNVIDDAAGQFLFPRVALLMRQ
jgi:VWFA-related protein